MRVLSEFESERYLASVESGIADLNRYCVVWVEPRTEQGDAVELRCPVVTAIKIQKEYEHKMDPEYASTDYRALIDFMSIHWATLVEV